jgi:hypothetical protein
MLGKLWIIVKKHIVGEVPDEMSACIDCDAVQCCSEQYATCSHRLARFAALQAMQHESQRPAVTDATSTIQTD